MDATRYPLTSFHWGTYRAETRDGKLRALHPFEEDPHPSPIGLDLPGLLNHPLRIKRPAIREGWLKRDRREDRRGRGSEPFVEVSWEEAETLVADELRRIIDKYGNEAIFGGSYGWASSGRFHHAQGQLKRFLNLIGGFVRSVNSYSLAAGEVIVDHVLGNYRHFIYRQTDWASIVGNTELFLAFGGLPIKNSQVGAGGIGRHRALEAMTQAKSAGVEFVNISPIRSDVTEALGAGWIAPRPNTDTALMLGLAHTLLVEGLHDTAFLDRCCVGFDRFSDYLLGRRDGQPKSAEWAARICEIDAETLRSLARRMAGGRTMISASWSLTRQDRGEQPIWMAVTLAAMLGQIGLPGGGFGLGYSAVNNIGLERADLEYQAFPQGNNAVSAFIPVARIADMLENPGAPFDYNGTTYRYPDIKAIYWAGGNPFHHHQDLNRLRRVWARPQTVIVHEWCWNPNARHADIVLPVTTPAERTDIALTPRDPYIVSMDQVADPPARVRNDFDIFASLAQKFGKRAAFDAGRDHAQWLAWIYERSRAKAGEAGVSLPTFEQLRERGWHKVEAAADPYVVLADFRADPDACPLKTPSGRIEIFSSTVDGFGYDDCPGHPSWKQPAEWPANEHRYPLHLISNQPRGKLHSQLDHGENSQARRVSGHEPVTMNPADAHARNIRDGDVVRVFNDRGACLCGAVVSDDIRPGVVQISTGAWFDPDETDAGTCRLGNPNVLTADRGTSPLAQGPSAQSCLVEIEKFLREISEIGVHRPPEFVART